MFALVLILAVLSFTILNIVSIPTPTPVYLAGVPPPPVTTYTKTTTATTTATTYTPTSGYVAQTWRTVKAVYPDGHTQQIDPTPATVWLSGVSLPGSPSYFDVTVTVKLTVKLKSFGGFTLGPVTAKDPWMEQMTVVPLVVVLINGFSGAESYQANALIFTPYDSIGTTKASRFIIVFDGNPAIPQGAIKVDASRQIDALGLTSAQVSVTTSETWDLDAVSTYALSNGQRYKYDDIIPSDASAVTVNVGETINFGWYPGFQDTYTRTEILTITTSHYFVPWTNTAQYATTLPGGNTVTIGGLVYTLTVTVGSVANQTGTGLPEQGVGWWDWLKNPFNFGTPDLSWLWLILVIGIAGFLLISVGIYFINKKTVDVRLR